VALGRLQVVEGPDTGRTVPLGDSVSVGRSPDCDVMLIDAEASRTHLRIVTEGDRVFVEDLASTNGTYVNGERILHRRELQLGDRIEVGADVIAFGDSDLIASGDSMPVIAGTEDLRRNVTAVRQAILHPEQALAAADSGSRKWWTLAVVCAAVMMMFIDTTIVAVALPPVSKALHPSFSDLQWVIDAYALMLAALLLTAGSLSDIIGRRTVFAGGIAVFTATSAVCGLADSPTVLDLARGAQGIGAAMIYAPSLALLVQEFPVKERPLAFGLWGAASGVGVALGPLVGGLLIAAFSWRAVFFVNVPIGLAALVVTLVKLVNLPGPPAKIDLPGLITFSGAMGMLVFVLIRGNDLGWGSAEIISLLGGAVLLLDLFVLVEMCTERPMLDLGLFRKPTFSGAMVVALAVSCSLLSVLIYLTLFLQTILGYSPLQSGLRFLPLTGLVFVFSPLGGRLGTKVPARVMLTGGLATCGLGLLLMHRVGPHSHWTVLLPGMLIAGAGLGIINAPLATTAVGIVPPWRSGMAGGANSTFRQLGQAVGIAGLGAIFEHSLRHHLNTTFASTPISSLVGKVSNAIASGGTPEVLARVPSSVRGSVAVGIHASFASALSEILLIAAVAAFIGAVLVAPLIRVKDMWSDPAGPGAPAG
jgi:EmrB/QacA subfamily drug resistance transporter